MGKCSELQFLFLPVPDSTDGCMIALHRVTQNRPSRARNRVLISKVILTVGCFDMK